MLIRWWMYSVGMLFLTKRFALFDSEKINKNKLGSYLFHIYIYICVIWWYNFNTFLNCTQMVFSCFLLYPSPPDRLHNDRILVFDWHDKSAVGFPIIIARSVQFPLSQHEKLLPSAIQKHLYLGFNNLNIE